MKNHADWRCVMEIAYDFEYDGKNLSDFGFMICEFETKDKNVVSNGSKITFINAKTSNGTKYEPTGIQYDTFLEGKFSICKNPCNTDNLAMSVNEIRLLSKWLNRKENLKFKPLCDEYIQIYFEGSFNIELVKYNGKVYGMNLIFKSNRPYALLEEKTFYIKNKNSETNHYLYDLSDVEGFIYPSVKIVIEEDGDLIIKNYAEDSDQNGRTTLIKNCTAGEIITMDYPIINSDNSSHNIQNDFNWNFFRIANSFYNNVNRVTISLSCSIEIRYSPIAKIGL